MPVENDLSPTRASRGESSTDGLMFMIIKDLFPLSINGVGTVAIFGVARKI
jgi:hypothetical protein